MLRTMTYNMNKRKTAKSAKAMKKFEPDYITTTREELEESKERDQAEERAELEDFWRELNPNAQYRD